MSECFNVQRRSNHSYTILILDKIYLGLHRCISLCIFFLRQHVSFGVQTFHSKINAARVILNYSNIKKYSS